MADLSFFNAEEVPPADSFEAIPAGNYMALIEDSDIVQTKAGTGTMLSLKLNILEGAYQNRKLFARINIQNINAQAQEIGQRQLSQLYHALGKIRVKESSELHMIPLIVRVGFQKDDATRNEIKEYKSISGNTAAPSTRPAMSTPPRQTAAPAPAAAQRQAAAPAASGAKPAWVR